MGLVNGFVDHKVYIRTVLKKRGLGHCLEDFNFDEMDEETERLLHLIAVEQEKNWTENVIRLVMLSNGKQVEFVDNTGR